MDEDKWKILQLNNTECTIAIDLETLKQKNDACSMLLCYVEEMKDGFAPFIDDTANLCVELLKIFSTDEVRTSCAALIPSLLRSKQLYLKKTNAPNHQSDLKKLFKFLLPSLLNSIKAETDNQLLFLTLGNLREVCTII